MCLMLYELELIYPNLKKNLPESVTNEKINILMGK